MILKFCPECRKEFLSKDGRNYCNDRCAYGVLTKKSAGGVEDSRLERDRTYHKLYMRKVRSKLPIGSAYRASNQLATGGEK